MLSTVPEAAVWAIFLAPVASLVVLVVGFPRANSRLTGYISIAAVAVSCLLSFWVLDSVIQSHGARLVFPAHDWLSFDSLSITFAVNVDGLSAVMLVVVTSVSLVTQVYSQGYMAGDGGYGRYFTYLSLFTASMLGLVLLDNLIGIYIFWEMVGATSYLLIGFWFHRPVAAAAAKKAFLVTRLGDLGFLLAILLIYDHAGTFNVAAIQRIAIAGALGSTTLTVFALGIFSGAVGKSAQFPLHVWLPDAMEGPTPVSALIHSATMVAAGVYLVARMFPVFDQSAEALHVVGAIGGITAIIAALIAFVMTDIKRVLAYSTISQLGYMMLALGVGAYVAAIFHLLTHAYFKSLLFLGSGSVNHATNTFDMRLMGGLRKLMPITCASFVIGSISLAGIFPFAGFWSKDEILSEAWANEKYLFAIALITAGLTAFYMFRAIFMTFGGEYRGGGVPEDVLDEGVGYVHGSDNGAHHAATPHESPPVMALPLVVLAIPAVLIGFVNTPLFGHGLQTLLQGALPHEIALAPPRFRWGVAIVSTVLPIAGIALAWAIYSAKVVSAQSLRSALRPIPALLENKYYLDDLYERVIAGLVFYRGICGAAAWFDQNVIDGAVNGVGRTARGAGAALRYVQTGQFQAYGFVGFAGVALAAILVLVFR